MKIVQIVVHGHRLLGLSDTGHVLELVRESKSEPHKWIPVADPPADAPAAKEGES